VLVNNRDVTQLPPGEIPLLRRDIGVIFQNFSLLSQKTVWENVAFALQVIGAPQKQLVRDVPRALETVGLHHKMDSRPHQLSGGEQQRVAIARAIVNNPAILVADEPTGNLDPQTGADIVNVLQRINEAGTTILMATHDRNVVDRLGQRVVRLADGRIVSDELGGHYHPEDGVLQQPRAAVADTALDATYRPRRPRPHLPPPEPAPPEPAPRIPDEPTPRATAVPEPAPVNLPLTANGTRQTTATPVPATPTLVTPPPSISTPAVVANGHGAVAEETERPVPAIEVRGDKPRGDKIADNIAAPGLVPHEQKIEESLIEKQRKNQAPLGSPENPLVQFDRITERRRD
jgi:cell division transport system ATP-binding protein